MAKKKISKKKSTKKVAKKATKKVVKKSTKKATKKIVKKSAKKATKKIVKKSTKKATKKNTFSRSSDFGDSFPIPSQSDSTRYTPSSAFPGSSYGSSKFSNGKILALSALGAAIIILVIWASFSSDDASQSPPASMPDAPEVYEDQLSETPVDPNAQLNTQLDPNNPTSPSGNSQIPSDASPDSPNPGADNSGNPATDSVPSAVPSNVQGTTYLVQPGDTLNRIAEKTLGNRQRISEIIELNGLTSPTDIRVGQTLRLPPR